MHYHCEIYTPTKPESYSAMEKLVEKMMGPSDEHGGFWDWYELGGRWTGAHDNYNPRLDPANLEICDMCDGDGVRKDHFQTDKAWMESCRGCNVCHGAGAKVRYDLVPYEGDVMEISKVRDDLSCLTILIPPQTKGKRKAEYHELGKETVKEFLKSKGITEGYLITVDYHC